jgi:YhcG PDDEXK nuclease domain/DUF1016 N-terminal domain
VKKTMERPGRSAPKQAGAAPVTVPAPVAGPADEATLLNDLRALVQAARTRLATAANVTHTLLCWQVGRRLLREDLQAGRAAYGKQILATVSQTLSWSHFIELLPIKDPLVRDFYAEMCRIERWDVCTLRLKIGGMLFFHRHLRRLIAVELKLESFQPAHVGQMELYLRWLDKHERAAGEEAPIGLILCASADAEHVELLQLDAKSIRVSEYLTELPPLPLLRRRLHQAIEHAREQAARQLPDSRGPQ